MCISVIYVIELAHGGRAVGNKLRYVINTSF